MTAKEWLNRGYRIDREINQLLAEKASAGEQTHTSISYAAYDKLLDKRIDALYLIKREIVDAISSVNERTLRTLLFMRYVRFAGWEEIANELHYEKRHIYRLHGAALKAVQEILMSLNVTIDT